MESYSAFFFAALALICAHQHSEAGVPPGKETPPENTAIHTTRYLADNSDWWSLVRHSLEGDSCSPRNEKLAAKQFQILGVDLGEGPPALVQTQTEIGRAPVLGRGDASTGRSQVCFRSMSDGGRIKLIFEQGEVIQAAYLIDDGLAWLGIQDCVISPKVTRLMSTGGGLRLGMTVEEAKAILGQPCGQTEWRIAYDFKSQVPMSAQEKADTVDFPSSDYCWDWFSYIELRFAGGHATYIAISTGETN